MLQDGEGDGVVDYQSPRGRGRGRPFYQNRRYFGPPRGRGGAGRNYLEVSLNGPIEDFINIVCIFLV